MGRANHIPLSEHISSGNNHSTFPDSLVTRHRDNWRYSCHKHKFQCDSNHPNSQVCISFIHTKCTHISPICNSRPDEAVNTTLYHHLSSRIINYSPDRSHSRHTDHTRITNHKLSLSHDKQNQDGHICSFFIQTNWIFILRKCSSGNIQFR